MDFTAEQAGEFAADGKTKTGAAVFAAGGGVSLLKSLENDFLFIGRGGYVGVDKLKRYHRRRLAQHRMGNAPAAQGRGDVEPYAALTGELEGVRKKILEHLLQTLGVRGDGPPEVGIDMNVE